MRGKTSSFRDAIQHIGCVSVDRERPSGTFGRPIRWSLCARYSGPDHATKTRPRVRSRSSTKSPSSSFSDFTGLSDPRFVPSVRSTSMSAGGEPSSDRQAQISGHGGESHLCKAVASPRLRPAAHRRRRRNGPSEIGVTVKGPIANGPERLPNVSNVLVSGRRATLPLTVMSFADPDPVQIGQVGELLNDPPMVLVWMANQRGRRSAPIKWHRVGGQLRRRVRRAAARRRG